MSAASSANFVLTPTCPISTAVAHCSRPVPGSRFRMWVPDPLGFLGPLRVLAFGLILFSEK
jgi:hypothetical protein